MNLTNQKKLFLESFCRPLLLGAVPVFMGLTSQNVSASPVEKIETIKTSTLFDQQTISGVITDEEGIPLPGATVIVKGSNNGVMSDFEGSYQISAAPGDVLVFSYVGYETQEITVQSQAAINVALAVDSNELDEVVVVGYGTKKRSHLSAAVEQIDGEVVENRPLRSLNDGLQGTVAGLNIVSANGSPEAEPSLNIRGFTGFGTQGQPLILVDGVIRDRLSDVNPMDVESVTVLKDGAATAIYGSRAPYGAVLITTKKGKEGKMTVSVNANTRFSSPINLPAFPNSPDWMRAMNEAARNKPGSVNLSTPVFSDLSIERAEAWLAKDWDNPIFAGLNPDEFIPGGTYATSPTSWALHYEAFGSNDWYEAGIRNSTPSQQYDINISGGTKKANYYASVGYNETNGIFKADDYKNRYTSLIKFDTEVKPWLNLGFQSSYVRTDERGINVRGAGRNYSSLFNWLSRSFPNWPVYNPNGSTYFLSLLGGILDERGGFEAQKRNDLTLTGNFDLEPVKNWHIKGMYSWRTNSQRFNRTSLVDYQTLPDGTQTPTARTVGNSEIFKSKNDREYNTINLNTSYDFSLGNHNFLTMVGFQQELFQFDQLYGRATNIISPSVPTIGTSNDGFQTSDTLYEWAYRGYFGRFSYNFKEKYFAEFNGRYDATSRFLDDSRWAFFPSVSAAYNVAKEGFWPLKAHVSLFKLRGTWSTSGNGAPFGDSSNGGNYPFYPSINTGLNQSVILEGGFPIVASQPPLVNSQLTWEKPSSIGFGVDVAAFKNRLNFSYDWYQRTVRDQIGPPTVLPEVLGAAVPGSNTSESETRGWEFTIGWKDKAFNLAGKPFNYNVSFNMSDYVGYVTKYEDNGTGARGGQWTVGEVFGQNFHYTSAGVAQNVDDIYNNATFPGGNNWYYPGDLMLEDTNGDGWINSGEGGTWFAMGDLKKNGFSYPRKRYNFNLGANWNGFDVSALLTGVGEWTRYSNSMYIFGSTNSRWFSPYFEEHLELGYWRPDNTDAFFPRNSWAKKSLSLANDQYALDLGHLRIRNIRVGYHLPANILDRIGMDDFYLYFSGENLGYIYYNSFIKYDPELIASSSGQGYPQQRTLSFGVNLKL